MSDRVRKSIQAMTGYVPGEQPKGDGIIKLNTNENPYPPSRRVGEALRSLDADRLRLYPDPVSGELRARIGELHECDPARVFVGNGSDEVLALCTRAFVEDDETVGHFEPSYSLYSVLAGIRGVGCSTVELGADFGWPEALVGDAVGTALAGCSLFFLTRPNAPTGVAYPIAQVRDFCANFPGVVVIDEAYVDFCRDDCMRLAVELPNVLAARTLSKSYSLAGLRLGYAVGPPELIEALFKIKDSYNLNAISQHVALAALSDVDHMRRHARTIRDSRARMAAALTRSGFTVCPSEANFLWVRPSGTTAESLFGRLRGEGIIVRYFPGPRTGDFLRITVGTDEEIDRLLSAITRGTES